MATGQKQITHLSTEASGEIVSPDGKYLLVTSDVFPECGADDACNAKQLDADKNSKVKARLITGLLVPALDHMAGQDPQPSAFDFAERRQGGGPDARR